ncbi:hypothetical protein BH10PLA1_BH10PLA1_06540 [soil metagenome]
MTIQRNANILIVDDESNIRLMLRTVLETDGYHVTEASNGEEALDAMANGAFDVMILDLNMPILDGMSVLEEMQSNPPALRPRVIVLTAFGSIAAAVRATRLGALDFMEKPITPDDLRLTVAAVLSEPQSAQAMADDQGALGYAGVLDRIRKAMRLSDFVTAESLLMKAADLAEKDAAYFNLLGILYEARRQWRLAQKFYGKSMRADKKYEPAERNMRRIFELNTFGKSNEPVAFGDDETLFKGLLGSKKS